jgi:hypothetical protein
MRCVILNGVAYISAIDVIVHCTGTSCKHASNTWARMRKGNFFKAFSSHETRATFTDGGLANAQTPVVSKEIAIKIVTQLTDDKDTVARSAQRLINTVAAIAFDAAHTDTPNYNERACLVHKTRVCMARHNLIW